MRDYTATMNVASRLMYKIKIASNLENNALITLLSSVVLHVLIGRVSINSVINLDLASAKKTDN